MLAKRLIHLHLHSFISYVNMFEVNMTKYEQLSIGGGKHRYYNS